MNPYRKALIFATNAHMGQKRKNGDTYIIHPIRVSQEVKSEEQKIIALLHDTVEDTPTTLDQIRSEFGDHIAFCVDLLTHRDNEPYDSYIQRVKKHPDAVQVKIADIADNLSDAPTSKAITRSAAAIEELLKP
jgi:GTP pyrophosphokinase